MKNNPIKKIVCIRCAQVTLRSHLVENLGLPLFQALKNTVERGVQEDVARENNGSLNALGPS